jgi:nucleoside-diphosphate-sugar epimerase
MKRAFVTGGTGFIGSRLAKELLDNSWQVTALCRNPDDLKLLAGMPVTVVAGDVAEAASLEGKLANFDALFHCAALYREAKFADEVYWKVNFEGTKNLLEAARLQGCKYFIHCSTTGVTGDIKNPPADETYPYGPLDVYQESKTEAEKLVLSWFKESKMRGAVIRPTMVWGPRDTRLFKLFKGISQRRLPIIGTGKTLCHWVLVDDLVRGFRLAAETEKSNGNIYLVGGERVVTLEHTMRTIADFYNVKLLPFKIPAWPIQAVGSLVELIAKPLNIEPPIHRRRVDFFVKNRAFDCSKAARDLNYSASMKFEDEARFVAKWYLDNGWITLT